MESALKKTRRFWPLVASAALLLVLLAQPARALTKNWVGPKPNTLWTNANNWSSPGQPVTGDAAILNSTTNKTAVYDSTLNQFFIALEIDASGGSTFTLVQSANTLSASIENIGINGKGQFVQSGGTNTNSAFNLGNGLGSTGTYTLSGGGNLSTSGDQIIGGAGTGLFNQSGGNNTVGATLTLGFTSTGSGTYNLTGGNLTAQDETVGDQGTGTFTQSTNSTNRVSGGLTLGGIGTNAIGTYTMKGGYLQAVIEVVGGGIGNTGTFTQMGGTNNTTLFLGLSPTSNGTYNLLAGELVAPDETIGNGGIGQFIQSGGTNTVTHGLQFSNFVDSSGTYTLNAGSLNVTNAASTATETIGNQGTSIFTQKGGTHTADNLTLGDQAAGNGTYNLKQGSLKVTGTEFIGLSGTGTFNQIGGIHTVTGSIGLAGNGGSVGTYNLQGGTLSAAKINIFDSGTFNVKNTTTTVTGDVVVQIGGMVKTTNAKVTWNGNFTNNGAYISDPSTQTFNKDLSVGSGGYLMGSSQDLFVVKNDFINESTNGTQWNTILSSLKFATGADNVHDLFIPGVVNPVNDRVPPPNNFSWGTLDITGQTIDLRDGNSLNPSTALYVGKILGVTFNSSHQVTNIIGPPGPGVPIYIYFDPALNPSLGMNDYAFASGLGALKWDPPPSVPVPPSVFLLGSGLLGLGALGWRRRKM